MAAADVETGKPSPLARGVSKTGRMADFGTAEQEVERIMKHDKNFYYVLKVKKDTPASEIKVNYYKLSRLVHPDKCSHPRAPDAAATLNQAYDTLSNSIKKTAYDAYVSDINVDAPEGMSYAEWEASNLAGQVQVPAWVAALLRVRGGKWILLLLVLCVFIPLILIVLVLSIVLKILCLPCECLFGRQKAAPGGAPGQEDANAPVGGMDPQEAAAYMAARNAEAKRAATAAPVQQQPPAV